MSRWEPIETAPKDGTAILACSGPYNAKEYDLWPDGPMTVFWGAFHPNSPGKKEWRDMSGHRRPYLTHWMPLPEPPK